MSSLPVIDRPAEFDAKVMAHKRLIYRMARRFNVAAQDVEDFVNDVVLACLRRWKTYKAENNFFGWVVWQARGVRASFLQSASAKRRNGVLDDKALEFISIAPCQVENTHAHQLLTALSLEEYGAIVTMRAEGYLFSEIGARFGFSKQRAQQIFKDIVGRLAVCA